MTNFESPNGGEQSHSREDLRQIVKNSIVRIKTAEKSEYLDTTGSVIQIGSRFVVATCYPGANTNYELITKNRRTLPYTIHGGVILTETDAESEDPEITDDIGYFNLGLNANELQRLGITPLVIRNTDEQPLEENEELYGYGFGVTPNGDWGSYRESRVLNVGGAGRSPLEPYPHFVELDVTEGGLYAGDNGSPWVDKSGGLAAWNVGFFQPEPGSQLALARMVNNDALEYFGLAG